MSTTGAPESKLVYRRGLFGQTIKIRIFHHVNQGLLTVTESSSIPDVSDGAPSDAKLASYETLTGLVGTRDVPAIISMYAERKENNEKLLESKGRGEERLQRLKDEKAELEVALKQVKGRPGKAFLILLCARLLW